MIKITEKETNKLPGISSLHIEFDYKQEIIDTIKQIETSVYDKKTKMWEVPVTELAPLLDGLCLLDEIELNILSDDDYCSLYNYNTNSEFVKSVCKFKTSPFAYQREGIEYGLNHDSWLLLDAPGLGKSLQLIYLAQELQAQRNIEHCLIICGINTLKTNWKREIEKHSNMTCRILGQHITKTGKLTVGSVADRVKELNSKIDEFFIITNIETLRSDEIIKAIQKGPNKIDMCVVDEIHKAKSSSSTQGKNLLKLTQFKYKIAATGTLIMNNPVDAYVPLKWIGADRSTFTNFKYFYCTFGGPFHNILMGFKNTNIIKDQLEKYSLRRTKDLLDLPPKSIINEYVDMYPDQQSFYDNIKEGIINQVDKVHMSTSSLLGMVTRLRQATACPSILTTENISSAKIERAVDLVEEITSSGSKVVIFSTFKETVNKLAEQLSEYKPLICTGDSKDSDINNNIEIFQNDTKHKVFIATWQKMGTGVTLTAANYAIFLDTPWTNAEYEQSQDRIYRIGTNNNVFIYNIICTNTIDERVLEIVEDKSAMSDYIIDDKISKNGINSLRKYIEDL